MQNNNKIGKFNKWKNTFVTQFKSNVNQNKDYNKNLNKKSKNFMKLTIRKNLAITKLYNS